MTSWSGRAEDGATVRLDLPAEAAAPLLDHWPPIGLLGPEAIALGEGADHVVSLDATLADGQPTEQTWARLESDLALFAADHLADRVAVHAALITWQGRTALLPGPTHVGKSTLALALSDLGATVWTDEYALVDPGTGRATGWPRPLRRRRADGGVDRVTVPLPDGADPGAPLVVDLVAVLRFDPATWADARVAEITTADAVEALLANTVSAQRHPDRALDAALAVARGAAGMAGTRGEAAGAARTLLAQLESTGPRGEALP